MQGLEGVTEIRSGVKDGGGFRDREGCRGWRGHGNRLGLEEITEGYRRSRGY